MSLDKRFFKISTMAQVLLNQLHLCHCIILGLLLIEITIMCAKCMVQV